MVTGITGLRGARALHICLQPQLRKVVFLPLMMSVCPFHSGLRHDTGLLRDAVALKGEDCREGKRVHLAGT